MGGCVSVSARTGLYKRRRDIKTVTTTTEINPGTPHKLTLRLSATLRPTAVLDDPVGHDIFSNYRFGKELGRGEFGVTYQCFKLDTGDTFACKMISKSKLKTEIDIEDVRREVRIMRHLPDHPNIVTFKEAFEDKEAVYLVMELCQGGELFDQIVSKGHYTERAAANITKTMLEVCKICHQHGVIHRDLKPENFLFKDSSETSQLKAIDFGLSVFFDSGQRFNEIVGSPYYMAPEVLRRNYGPEVDVWSTGVILYILLCGVPPFWAETEEGIAQAIIRGSIDFERDPWPKVSANAKDLLKCMLDPNPYSRLTVEEVLEHPWIQNMDRVPNVSLGEHVRIRIKQFSLMNKFKKRVLRVVADYLSEEEIDGIKQIFELMDTDKNGDLTFEELKEGFCSIGHPITDSEVQMLIDAADADGTGTLNCEEFVTVSVHLKKISNEENLSQAFSYFDKNESGFIEFDELKEALLDHKLDFANDQVIHDILFDVDLDKDGRISYDEFKAMMGTGMNWKMSSRRYSRALLTALSTKLFKDKPLLPKKCLKSGPL
ncbi:calcium-dependent protein kinase 24 [Cannabis sativa]|uniref:calcium-dependent protein kinase 24 n=1 Tax=Cannabis sativa TaxID=3483 RepID=UPI0029C9EF3F|nr:calcium-dependent protein kinase 24 [Cannabis sativa]